MEWLQRQGRLVTPRVLLKRGDADRLTAGLHDIEFEQRKHRQSGLVFSSVLVPVCSLAMAGNKKLVACSQEGFSRRSFGLLWIRNERRLSLACGVTTRQASPQLSSFFGFVPRISLSYCWIVQHSNSSHKTPRTNSRASVLYQRCLPNAPTMLGSVQAGRQTVRAF